MRHKFTCHQKTTRPCLPHFFSMSKYGTSAAAAAVASAIAGSFLSGAKHAALAEAESLGRSAVRGSASYLRNKVANLYSTPTKRATAYRSPRTTPLHVRSIRRMVTDYAGPPAGSYRSRAQRYRGFRRSGRIYFPKRRRRTIRRRRYGRKR